MKRKNRGCAVVLLALLMTLSSWFFIFVEYGGHPKLDNIKVNLHDTKLFISTFLDKALAPFGFEINNGIEESQPNQNLDYGILSEKINTKKEFTIQGITIGTPLEELISKLGEPNRKDLSKYGFEWYVYNDNYSKYIQVGIQNNKVVGIYTNADNWESLSGIKIGTDRTEVESVLENPLESIRKGNVIYPISNTDQKSVYLTEDGYATIFYDIHNNNTVTSINIIAEDVELSLKGYYGEYSEKLIESFEEQVFDLANVIRVRSGLKPFKWSDKAKISSRKHSQDMADNNYFDHTNLSGKDPFNRMKSEGIMYLLAAENIAAGTADAIEAHEGWMNSLGHRKNILGDCKTLGVGVAYNSNSIYKYYYTQNFFTGM